MVLSIFGPDPLLVAAVRPNGAVVGLEMAVTPTIAGLGPALLALTTDESVATLLTDAQPFGSLEQLLAYGIARRAHAVVLWQAPAWQCRVRVGRGWLGWEDLRAVVARLPSQPAEAWD